MTAVRERWNRDMRQVREQMDRAPTPRARERWPALWLLARGWPAVQVAAARERDPHPIGAWVAACERSGPAAVAFGHTGGSPPPAPRTPRPSCRPPSTRRPARLRLSERMGMGRWCVSSCAGRSDGP
jgi:hypothetical protein